MTRPRDPMHREGRFVRPPARSRRAALLAVVLLACTAVASCSARPTAAADPSPSVEIDAGLVYSSPGGTDLKLDACTSSPRSDEPTGAVILLHGGGFTEGDRSGGGMRALCTLVAEHGFAAFSIDYRLAPDAVYPSQVDDVDAAIAWVRQPEQAERFGVDPARIGLLGSSAGAILAQTVATRGEGPLDTGSRVAAVVSLSGVSLMTEAALTLGQPSEMAASMILNYLGCDSVVAERCPHAAEASPELAVDPSDPPMILVNGSEELVPVEQAQSMAEALRAADVPVELSVQDSSKHGVSLLSGTVRARILEFFTEHLS